VPHKIQKVSKNKICS